MKQLWVEKYRPKKVSEYVWRDDHQKQIVLKWIEEKSLPNILLSGQAGAGKSSIIAVLINELEIDDGDVLEINASEETSVEVVRTKIINFASTIPFGEYKVCILEEADALSQAAQKSLKRVIETNSDNCRFIFTTNEVHKINAANFSRFQHFHFEQIDEELFIERLMFILEDNDVEYSPDDLIQYVKGTYPDLRKSIGMLEMNVCDGKLLSPSSDSKAKLDYMVKVIDLFKKGKVKEARTTIIENASQDEYTEIFRFLYRNIELFGDEDKQCRALVIIRDGMYKDAIVADREINLSATLAEISMIGDE
jgi:replication factor C small subunit